MGCNCEPISIDLLPEQLQDIQLTDYVFRIGGTDNYDELINKPSINGVVLQGNKTSADLHIDQTYVYEQQLPSDTWTITHNLGKYPSVTIVDSAGTTVVGDVTYLSNNAILVQFSAPFGGKAFLN